MRVRPTSFRYLCETVIVGYACAQALGYVPTTLWWLHMMFWPSLALAPIFAVGALWALIDPGFESGTV